MNPVQPITIGHPSAVSLADAITRQTQERGLTPMPLEPETLLRRVRALDWSGEFLGEALISAYWKDHPFNNSLFQIINLDAEGFRLFHQILHIRLIPGWRDDVLHALVTDVREILSHGEHP